MPYYRFAAMLKTERKNNIQGLESKSLTKSKNPLIEPGTTKPTKWHMYPAETQISTVSAPSGSERYNGQRKLRLCRGID